MINKSILFLPHTDCANQILRPFATELGIRVNWDPDLHLGKPLAKVFSHVIRYDIGEAYSEFGVLEANRRIIELIKIHSPSYVIWPTMTYEILEDTFQEIRKLGVYVIGWFFDDEIRFDDYSRWWIPFMDFFLTADKNSVTRYQKLGAKAYHLLVTGEPEDFQTMPTKMRYDVSFVGTKYVADRDHLVKSFLEDGIAISAFGRGWDNGFVSHEEMVNIFNSSKINICFTKSYGRGNQLKGKIFDITLSGGFLLCEYVKGIEELFVIDKEIVCFKTYAEALEKIKYFLEHDYEREKVANAGRLKAIRELAQSKLLQKIFLEIEKNVGTNFSRVIVSDFKMPKHVNLAHAGYHLRWANVLKENGFKNSLVQDEYDVAANYKKENFIFDLRYRIVEKLKSLIRLMTL